MTIMRLIATPSWGSYYFEDLARIRQDLVPVAERYHLATVQQTFPYVRTPASSLSIGLVLADGQVAWGDCVPVSFSGKAGRAIPKDPQKLLEYVESDLAAWFKGRPCSSWRKLEEDFLREFADMPAFLRYGISQAMATAVSVTTGRPLWRIFADELQLPYPEHEVALHGSCGGDWDGTVDRMLARRVPFLPQGQFEDLTAQIGPGGQHLLVWVRDFVRRAQRFQYEPVLTLDFHGALDVVFGNDVVGIANFIGDLVEAASPLRLHIESPIAALDMDDFVRRMTTLHTLLAEQGLVEPALRLVADEWANEFKDLKKLCDSNSVDGVHIKMPDTGTLLECAKAVELLQQRNKFALLGGSCTETMNGAKATAHLALVTKPDAVLVKPGMGFDESYAWLHGEMVRSLAEARLFALKRVEPRRSPVPVVQRGAHPESLS